jgi:dTDP-4-dehydrorhamnose reductase
MKILLTGSAGQLGQELMPVFRARGHEVTGLDRRSLNLDGKADVAGEIAAYGADWIINCAAYTRVDQAESDSALAFAVNRDAAAAIAQGASRAGSRLLHLSTDFVFGGRQSTPYRESDRGDPVNVYGQSKWEGELRIQEFLPKALILRTAWVYGVHGNNFVKTMLRLMAEREELSVVDDQLGTPTWTADIVRTLLALIERQAEGIYHFTNEGVASWYDLAWEVWSVAQSLGLPVATRRLVPIASSQWPTAARRPAYSVLCKEKIRPMLGQDIAHWRQSLRAMLEEYSA